MATSTTTRGIATGVALITEEEVKETLLSGDDDEIRQWVQVSLPMAKVYI